MSSAARTRVEPAPADEGARAERVTELVLAFRHAYRSLRSLSGRDTHLLPGELSHAQFVLMGELLERGPLAAGELACAAALSPASVSQMLDHLSAEGHVERVRSKSDRRVVVTKLTRRGRRQIEARRRLWASRWQEAMEGVEDDELKVAAEVLERVSAIFVDPVD